MGPYPVWDLPPQPSFKLNYRWTQHWSSLQNFKIPIFKYPSLLFQCTSLRQAKRRLAKPSEIGSQISVHVNSSMNRYTQFLTIYLSLLIDQIRPPPTQVCLFVLLSQLWFSSGCCSIPKILTWVFCSVIHPYIPCAELSSPATAPPVNPVIL